MVSSFRFLTILGELSAVVQLGWLRSGYANGVTFLRAVRGVSISHLMNTLASYYQPCPSFCEFPGTFSPPKMFMLLRQFLGNKKYLTIIGTSSRILIRRRLYIRWPNKTADAGSKCTSVLHSQHIFCLAFNSPAQDDYWVVDLVFPSKRFQVLCKAVIWIGARRIFNAIGRTSS